MVSFKLTDEQTALKEMARKFAQNEIVPKAHHYDETGEFPVEILKKTFETGLMNMAIPAEHGGYGTNHIDSCVAAEEISAGCVGIGTSVMANDLALTPVVLAASHEQKEKFLRPFTEEFKLASFCLTEPGAGSDAGSVSTTAKLEGDKYILNGSKCFITNGGYADLYVVFAATDKSKGHKGLSTFVVPKELGVKAGKKEKKMGQRASNTTDVIFEDVAVPKENLVGKEGDGFKIAMMTLDHTRAGVAAAAVGVARAAYEYAVAYAKERIQFGMPIAMFQGIQFMLADMYKDIEAARMLTWYAAWLADDGIRNSKESSAAKAFASDVAMRVTTDAVQIFGGYGYSQEYPVEKLMRDAKLLQIYEGTSQIQRLVIAKEILTR